MLALVGIKSSGEIGHISIYANNESLLFHLRGPAIAPSNATQLRSSFGSGVYVYEGTGQWLQGTGEYSSGPVVQWSEFPIETLEKVSLWKWLERYEDKR